LSLIVNCPDCQSPVSVPDSLLGQQVKCQHCQAIFIVERRKETRSSAPVAPPPAAPEAPLRRDVPHQPSQRTGRDGASEEPPPPRERRPRRERPQRRPRREEFDDAPDESAQPVYDYRHPAPHRGNTIQTLGVFSILTCCVPILGIGLGAAAISMANTDITEIDSGRMDPSGRGQTQTGQTCGYIGGALSILAFVAELVMILGKK